MTVSSFEVWRKPAGMESIPAVLSSGLLILAFTDRGVANCCG